MTFFHSSNFSLCKRGKKWVCTCCMCRSKGNSLLLVFPPSSWSSNSEAHRTEICRAHLSQRKKSIKETYLTYILSMAYSWSQIEKVQAIWSLCSGWWSGGKFGSGQTLEECQAAMMCSWQLCVCSGTRRAFAACWHQVLTSVSSGSRHKLMVSSRVLITQYLH